MTAEQRAVVNKEEILTASKTVTMSTMINGAAMNDNQQQIYLMNMQIQEITALLNRADLGIPPNPRDRSPSPEPIYNSNGKRMNTRLESTRNKLISQRNGCITRLKDLDPSYQPPSQFRYKDVQLEEKVTIPAEVSAHLSQLLEGIITL
jgi:hypothetical protein